MTDILKFDAAHIGAAWLSVIQAAGVDKEDPVFYRSMSVELYEGGLRLTAIDRTILLSAYVPSRTEAAALVDPPELDEAPRLDVIAFDPDQRAVGLMKYALSLIGKDQPPLDVNVYLGESDSDPLALPGLDSGPALVLEVPGREAVRLTLVDQPWPGWRSLFADFKAVKTDYIGLSPPLIARLAKLGQWHEGEPLVWHFGGAQKAARLDIGAYPIAVQGLVMPMCWEPKVTEGADQGTAP